jgi:hypothetical protein
MVKATCVNDTNKPKQIPQNKWLVKDNEYTIIKVTIHPNQNGIQGCELAEISLDETCLPYEYYKLDRFAISQDDLEALIELMKLSSTLNDVEINELIKESELVITE